MSSPDPLLISRPDAHNERVEKLIAAFEREFGRRPEGIADAPGRVNLIGEHVDYNDGLVLPFAIDRSVMCAWARPTQKRPFTGSERFLVALERLRQPGDGHPVRRIFKSLRRETMRTLRDDKDLVWFQSADDLSGGYYRPQAVRFPDDGDTDTGIVEPRAIWKNYVHGVSFVFERVQLKARGALTMMTGDVPQGAGLSSSAALEVVVAGAFRDAFSLDIGDVALAELCQRAENEYVGVQCGIMDQFASTLSKRDHALLVDCRTLAYRHIPMRLEAAGLAVVVANSGVKRELASSAFNERRRECEEAVALLRERLGRPELASLRDVTDAEVDGIEIDSVLLRRARHVVTEIGRVAAAVEALERDDFEALGRLMVESHLSLRDDYAVSSEELDLLVGLATAQDDVLGARLTGAGFGGCTVNLVRADAVDAFARDVVAPYRERTGLPAEMYVTKACDGLRTWRL